MKTALAAALVVLSVSGASAQPDRVAWAGPRDVVEAVRAGRSHARPHPRRRHHARHFSRRIHGARYAATGRPRAWCGWFLGQLLNMPDRRLWLARNWASVGHAAHGPGVGVIVVWRHHVGIITGRHGSQWIVKSGNDGHRVRERPRSVAGAIAFRVRA